MGDSDNKPAGRNERADFVAARREVIARRPARGGWLVAVVPLTSVHSCSSCCRGARVPPLVRHSLPAKRFEQRTVLTTAGRHVQPSPRTPYVAPHVPGLAVAQEARVVFRCLGGDEGRVRSR
ncbi:hypothetical protein E2C01_044423 [Portunus trituberculatus]|uniref:Uncharacterized protein n=1 Tax=Portunus trituberculatus TaxID=210409 RepID=A0A5B7G2A3_PORTR|nr:hypothetical protein [Portunus trituberculatus]